MNQKRPNYWINVGSELGTRVAVGLGRREAAQVA
jgi:hypothetical protein